MNKAKLSLVICLLASFAWLLAGPGCDGTVGGQNDAGGDADPADGADAGGDLGADPGGDLGGDPGGDEGPPACPDDEHRCGADCVDDDAVEHCGDRCEPCPQVDNASPTCEGQVCGFTCAAGFLACLGECIPQAEGPCGVNLPANIWVKVSQGDVGPRRSATMVYDAAAAEYVLVGGSMPISAVPRPYDVQSMSLADRVWKNRYPLGKAWGPELGDSLAPGFGTEHFVTEDESGHSRPNWSTYPSINTYHQHAFDPAGGRLLFHLWNRTFSYDLAGRSWTFHASATDPAGGPSMPRLLWGAMAMDPAAPRVLLVGGGNVFDEDGRPGTWFYRTDLDSWQPVPGGDPGPRAVPGLVSDPDRRQALLFGGDELDVLKADTWLFDFASESWSELSPATSPAPRGGHQLLFLPTSRRVVLLGGFAYSSTTDYVASHYQTHPWAIWRFDFDAPAWELVKRFDAAEEQPGIGAMRNVTWAAAAGAGDVVVIHVKKGYAGEMDDSETWAIRIDPSVIDAAGTATHGVGPGTTSLREGPYDPAWYETGWPDPDPVAFAALLDAIPVNTWTEIQVPNRPAHNHDWGTAAMDPVRKRIYRWSGGHSAHSGTDVLEYDMNENRYHMYYPPEFPLQFEYSNDQVPGHWSFKGRPFMTGHTYKTYAYSSALDRMVIWKKQLTYFYDPDAHEFELPRGETDGGGSMYTTVLCPVSDGLEAWTPGGLWRLDPLSRDFEALPISGQAPPAMSPDSNILVHDTARDRLLMFASTGDNAGQVWAYDRQSGALAALDPAGRASIQTDGPGFYREAVYLPSHDAVVLGAAYDNGDGSKRVPVYHAAENRWYAYAFAGQSAQDEAFGVSLGLMLDAQERIWAINSSSYLFLLKLDPNSADRIPL